MESIQGKQQLNNNLSLPNCSLCVSCQYCLLSWEKTFNLETVYQVS